MDGIGEVIGRNMRRVREAHGKVLADIAGAAQDLGIGWDRSAASRIELGQRDLTLSELAELPAVMTVACDEIVTLADLLPFDPVGEADEDPVASFVWRLAEPFATAYEPTAVDPPWSQVRNVIRAAVRDEVADEWHHVQAARGTAVKVTATEELDILGAELGVPEWEVRSALFRLEETGLWHRGTVQAEREYRLRDSVEDLANPTHVRTVRGNITRQLLRELRAELEAMKEQDGVEGEAAEREDAGAVADAGRR